MGKIFSFPHIRGGQDPVITFESALRAYAWLKTNFLYSPLRLKHPILPPLRIGGVQQMVTLFPKGLD